MEHTCVECVFKSVGAYKTISYSLYYVELYRTFLFSPELAALPVRKNNVDAFFCFFELHNASVTGQPSHFGALYALHGIYVHNSL